MKNLKLFLTALIAVSFLAACDDGGNSDSTGRHADITKAKKLLKEFEKSNVLSKGYIRPQNSYDVIRTLNTYGRGHANYFYQMHEIGCIKKDGSVSLTIDKEINTASLIVGTLTSNKKSSKEKATYVQTNKPDNCYFAGGQINGGFGGIGVSKDWKWGRISNCQTLVTHAALKRVDKEQLNGMNYSSLTPPHAMDNGGFYVDYWRDPRWSPYRPTMNQEDSYFLLQRHGTRYYGPALNDRFETLNHGRGLFVSETVGLSDVGNNCAKTVYYGHAISSQGPVIANTIMIQEIK